MTMRRTLLMDVAIAVVIAALVLILSPGLAVVGILAIIVLLICGASWIISARRARRRGARWGRPAPQRSGGRRR